MGEASLVANDTQTPLQRVSSQRRPCKRLTREDIGIMLRLRADGLSQAAIAQRLGCDQAAVNRWLVKLTDTTEIAKSFLRGSALSMAQNIVAKGRAADHVKTLEGLDVLSNQEVRGGLTIIVGSNAQVQVNVGMALAESPLSPLQIEQTGEGAQKH